ncbi:3-ketoacyl-CoA synthase 7-like [Salvia miltiorrhiza]|uniref:3-ketoacyl-CoA synthase 7-like n=1 Tax=Salvia miltiorrhiza TaxID=226208 RepID=UPI0025AC9CC5|nr:3-ketoacyl-CoA synthase 7-like [Salvia miltiorrhiza]
MDSSEFSVAAAVVVAVSVAVAVAVLMYKRSKKVYLLDFKCYQAPSHYRVPFSALMEHLQIMGRWSSEAMDFQKKVMERSGIGNQTYLPDGMQQLPMDYSLSATTHEIHSVLFQIVHNLLSDNNVHPRAIDLLITNCSLTSPTPSLASMLVNRFGFRSNLKTFNLAGMGCSAGILALHLARDVLRVHSNSLALILSMESVSANFYEGDTKSMLLANCLFRMGGAGALLSNRPRDSPAAKYQLLHVVRTHLGAHTPAYDAVVHRPDAHGRTGVALSRLILQVAGEALRENMEAVGAAVLPYWEQAAYVWGYVPEFGKAIDHFCIHAGGRAVIEAIAERLRLRERDVEASKMTLCRFGNTSSSSTWYELAYLEAKGRVKRGDKVWQLAFGSGFKCNTAVWKCVSQPRVGPSNVWYREIHMYPLQLPNILYY